ncbi:MAG: DivIVA domain-containing protein [Bacillales bacterium]|nr:DivIVA domain-containing protein [Bacillales bacterium]
MSKNHETKLSPQKIVDKVFQAAKHGYNALEVDKYLDDVIEDYTLMQDYICSLEKELEELKKSVKLYKGRLEQSEIQNAIMSEKLKNISDNDSASLSNIDLLKRISVLEQTLYKAGIDPTNIK